MKIVILAKNHTMPGTPAVTSSSQGTPANGFSQPPRKKTTDSAETRIMLAYSARKNTAKPVPEYSTWKPATISDSPSATSKGARLVSATPEMKYTRNSGNSGSQYQWKIEPSCARTMSPRFSDFAAISTPTSAKPMAIS